MADDGRLPYFKRWVLGPKSCATCMHGWPRKAMIERETGKIQKPCHYDGKQAPLCRNLPPVEVHALKGRTA